VPAPLVSWQGYVGLVGHPAPAIDLYAYLGTEQASSRAFTASGSTGGFGNGVTNNTGCYVQDPAAACGPNRKSATQVTLGGWWPLLRGDWGKVLAGAEYSYTWINTFKGGTGGAPRTNEQVFILGLRYVPSQ
jgi:hypothetical protein